MWSVRILPIILTASLTLAIMAYAQNTPAPDISLPAGDAVRGKTIFEGKGNCQNCHRVNGVGSLFGPDLSAIGAPPRGGGGGGGRGGGGAAPPAGATGAPANNRGAAAPVPPVPGAPAAPAGGARAGAPAFGGDEAANAAFARGAAAGRGGQGGNAPAGPTIPTLAQSILDPNAVVSVQNRYVILKMKDGKTITGKLYSIDTFGIQILDSSQKPANINRENVREMTMASPMPSYRDKLNNQELADVISYLMSLKGSSN